MSEQPRPRPGNVTVPPIAASIFQSMLHEQDAKGRWMYGTSLQTHNGRDAFRDAMEEAVDLWQYLVQARLEHADALQQIEALKAEVDEARYLAGLPLKYGGEVG